MSDTKISALPLAAAPSASDLLPMVQGSGSSAETRRASFGQIRNALLAERAVHVRDYGAVGDGVTNDAPAIQAAIDAMRGNGGGILQFGPRRYRIASPVVIDGVAIRFEGAGFTEGPSPADGTWFVVDTTGFTPFTFTGMAARGSAVRNLAVWQSHTAAQAAGWVPTDYDYVFRVVDCYGAVDFENLFLCAVNRGILCDNSGRMNIQRLRGQVFTCGVEIDRGYDAPRLHHVHFWPFWSSNENVVRWQQQNGDALLFRRCDGVFMDDIFALGCRSMLRFASSASGVTTKFYLGSGYADFARFGIWAEGNGIMGQVANLTTQGELFNGAGAVLADGNGIRLDGNNAQIQIGNLRVDDCESSAIRVNGQGNRLDVFSFRAEVFNRLNDGSAAIHVADVASGTANQVFLGSPAILGDGSGGPLANAGTNGHVAMMAPAGRADRPGLMVGATNAGLYATAAGDVAVSAGGVEMLRASPSSGVTLGGAPGRGALTAIAPGNAVNELRVTGSAAYLPVTVAASGSDTNITLRLQSKGTGTVQVMPRGLLALEASAVASNVNSVRVTGSAAGGSPQIAAQGSDANVSLALSAKGGGAVQALSPLQLPSFTLASLPAASGYARCVVYVSDGSGGRRLAVSDGSAWRWADGAAVS